MEAVVKLARWHPRGMRESLLVRSSSKSGTLSAKFTTAFPNPLSQRTGSGFASHQGYVIDNKRSHLSWHHSV